MSVTGLHEALVISCLSIFFVPEVSKLSSSAEFLLTSVAANYDTEHGLTKCLLDQG